MPADNQRRVARADTTQLGRGSGVLSAVSPFGLPPDLAEKSAARLGWTGLIYSVCYIIMHLVYRYAATGTPIERYLPFHLALMIAGVVMGGSVCGLAWSRRLPSGTMLGIGLLFEVAAALVISLSESLNPYQPGDPIRGHSAIAFWVVFFVLVVPASLGKSGLAAFATACMGPVGLGINIVVNGVPTPPALTWLLLYMSCFLMAFAAVLLSRFVYNLGAQMTRHKDLGSYELLDLIGKGGMGEVWRARHRLLVRQAAIKLIRPEVLVGDSAGGIDAARKRFEREAQSTAALHSPHTVAIHDYGIADDGSFYYVMELLQGMDLDSFIGKFGPMAAGRVVFLMRQVCDSLAEAHASGLTHRDVKPRNIFLCRLGMNYDVVKVLDFGLVKVKGASEQSRLTREGVTTGTPAYMAPEMAMGHFDVDGRTDIYALGCVMYWLLTGELVFTAPNALSMALEHVKSAPVPPSERTELEIPPELDALVLRCLEKQPRMRPQSAPELSRLLRDVPLEDPWDNEKAEEWWRIHMPRAMDAAAIHESSIGS